PLAARALLWERSESPSVPRIRSKAGNVLLRYDDPELDTRLAAYWRDPVVAHVAVQALLRRDPSVAIDTLRPCFSSTDGGDRRVARHIVDVLCEDAQKHIDDASSHQGWLTADSRWLELAVRHERDHEVAPGRLLKFFSSSDVRQIRKSIERDRRLPDTVLEPSRLSELQRRYADGDIGAFDILRQ